MAVVECEHRLLHPNCSARAASLPNVGGTDADVDGLDVLACDDATCPYAVIAGKMTVGHESGVGASDFGEIEDSSWAPDGDALKWRIAPQKQQLVLRPEKEEGALEGTLDGITPTSLPE